MFEIERVKQSGGMLEISAKPGKPARDSRRERTTPRSTALRSDASTPAGTICRCWRPASTICSSSTTAPIRGHTGGGLGLIEIAGESDQDADRDKLPGIGKITRILPIEKRAGIDRVRLGIAELLMKLIRLSERPRSDGETTLVGGIESDVDLLMDEIALVAGRGDRRGLMNAQEAAPGEIGQTGSGREVARQFSGALPGALKS